MTLALLAALTGTLGCGLQDLTRPSQVVRLRVLAIQAEPPEIGLGESTTFRFVLGNPGAVEVAHLWFACAEVDTGLGFTSCGSSFFASGDPTAETFEFAADPDLVVSQEQDDAGVVTDVTLEQQLASLDPLRRVEGIGFKVYLMVLPADQMQALLDDLFAMLGGGGSEEDLAAAFDDVLAQVADNGELATKRVVVSDKSAVIPAPAAGCEEVDGLQPNGNPDLRALGRLDAVTMESIGELVEGGSWIVEPGETVVFRPTLGDAAVEAYYYVSLADESTECRVEQPLFGWYATGGTFSGDYSFVDEAWVPGTVEWTADSDAPPGPVDAWGVVWDRRGGLDWLQFRFEVAGP